MELSLYGKSCCLFQRYDGFTLTSQMYHRISVLVPVLVRVPEYLSTSTSTMTLELTSTSKVWVMSTRNLVLEYWVRVPQPCCRQRATSDLRIFVGPSGSRDWSRSPDAGRHIGKFSLWTTLLRFSSSAQIFLFSNFTKLGQLFFDNIFFGLTS